MYTATSEDYLIFFSFTILVFLSGVYLGICIDEISQKKQKQKEEEDKKRFKIWEDFVFKTLDKYTERKINYDE